MSKFKFSIGPWNVNDGTDVYGPATRPAISLEEKIKRFSEMGFSAVQFHDDDAVPNLNALTEEQIKEEARDLKKSWINTAWPLNLWLPGCGWTPIPPMGAT